MSKNEIARPKVILDGQQAEAELDKLTQKANKYRDAMLAAASVGDLKQQKDMARNLKQTNTEISNLKKEAFSVEAVLKNLNGASFNEIAFASRKAAADLKKMKQTDPGYEKQKNDAQLLKTKMSELSKQSGVNVSALDKLKTTATGLLPAFGFTAIAAGAKYAFDQVVNSTDVLSTKWAVFTGGLRSGMAEFWRTIAVGDWSNFTENMKAAIKVGRDYETMLDDIEEKSRALRIKEAEARKTELDLEEKLKNTGLSKAERLKAGQDRIKLEEDLAKERVKVAQESFDAELKVTQQQTRLSKEQLMQVVSDMDSETKIKAKAYLEQLDLYKTTLKKSDQFRVAAALTRIIENPFAKEIADSKAVLDSYPESVKIYSEAIKGVGSTTDDQLNKMVSAYEGLLQATDSAAENTKKTRTMVNSLFADEDSENEKLTAKKIAAAKKLSDDLADFLKKDAQSQKNAINMYFYEAGEEAFDEFMKAIEAKQASGKIDFSILPETPEETEKQDSTLDYAVLKYQESIEYQLLLNETLHEKGLRGEQEYQDELTRLSKEGEDKRNALKTESIEKAQQFSQLGANFVSALMDMELEKAGDNEEKKAEIRKKYARVQFLVSASQIIVDTASAIMKALAQLGPIGGAIAAGIIGATGAVQLGVAYQQMSAVNGYAAGGYTNGDRLYRAGEEGVEFIGNAKSVRNPSVRKIFDIVDMAQQNGTIATINLPAVMNATGMLPKSSLRSNIASEVFQVNTGQLNKQAVDPELKKLIVDNTAALRELINWKPNISVEMYEKKREVWNNITKNRGLQ